MGPDGNRLISINQVASGRKNGLAFYYQQEELLLTGRNPDQVQAHMGETHWTKLTTIWDRRTDEETQGDTGGGDR